jgi:hypothetical protein
VCAEDVLYLINAYRTPQRWFQVHMNVTNRYDSIEALIFDEDIRIKAVDIHTGMDLLVIILNSGKVLQYALSNHRSLSSASPMQLSRYQLTGEGTGIHWPALDEDLSLKGILRETLKSQIKRNKIAPHA